MKTRLESIDSMEENEHVYFGTISRLMLFLLVQFQEFIVFNLSVDEFWLFILSVLICYLNPQDLLFFCFCFGVKDSFLLHLPILFWCIKGAQRCIIISHKNIKWTKPPAKPRIHFNPHRSKEFSDDCSDGCTAYLSSQVSTHSNKSKGR